MKLDTYIKDFSADLNIKEAIDKSLLQKIIAYVGPVVYNSNYDVDLQDNVMLEMIKSTFIVDVLQQNKEAAEMIINNVKSKLTATKKVNKTIFYYLIFKEIEYAKYRLPNIHPGEVLSEEFLKPMEISAYKLSKEIGIPQTRISAIIKGERRITPDTALRLSAFFGNSAKFWLGLQNDYDIEELQKIKLIDLIQIKKAA